MQPIPITSNALVLRTDFSDDALWDAVERAIREPAEFLANVDFLSDRRFDGASLGQLLSLIPDVPRRYPHTFLFVADDVTIRHPEHPMLVVDLMHERGRTFRIIPDEMWGVENNLSIANMDFAEFADAVDDDGIFRGFK